MELYIPQLTDIFNVKDELARLDKKLFSNERFVANAKPEVVQKERDKETDLQAKYDEKSLFLV